MIVLIIKGKISTHLKTTKVQDSSNVNGFLRLAIFTGVYRTQNFSIVYDTELMSN